MEDSAAAMAITWRSRDEYADLVQRGALEVPGQKIVIVAAAMPADPDRFVGATDYEARERAGRAARRRRGLVSSCCTC